MKISDFQAMVAKTLVPGPKTLDEISSELGEDATKVKEALNSLMKLGLVRFGKDKYRLVEAVRRGLESKEKINPEDYKFRVYAIFEGISESKSVLEKAQENLLARFRSDPRFEIIDLNIEDVIESEGVFSSMFEAEIVTRTFHDLVYLVLTYGPSSIELIEPARFELKASEAQAIIVDVAEAVHAYAQMVTDLNKKLYGQSRPKPKVSLKLNKHD